MNNFNFPDFDFDIDLNMNFDFKLDPESEIDNSYVFNKRYKHKKESQIIYDNAKLLAKSIKIDHDESVFAFINGTFIYGDFIEAFIIENKLKVPTLQISTLSMSENNIDSIANLVNWGYVLSVELLISEYFFAHERRNLIPYIFEKIPSIKLAVSGTHTKIAIFETTDGHKYCFHGSANLRSSNCVEQVVFEENKTLFDFIHRFNSSIISDYSVTLKSKRGKKLWQVLNK